MADSSESGNTPAAEKTATPAAGEQTPSQPKQEDTVTLSKQEHDELQKKAAQTATAQRDADILKKQLERKDKRKVAEPVGDIDEKELGQARSLITSKLLSNADYQKLTADNPLLAKVLTHTPWQILDNEEFVDAKDMADQVFDYLDNLLLSKAPSTTPAPATDSNPKPVQPETTAPKGDPTDEDKKRQEADKNLPLADRIANKIAGRINVSS